MQKEIKLAKIDTTLAGKRTILAATRTLLSHIRTALVFVSVALAFMKLQKDEPVDALIILLFVMAGVFLIIGIIDFYVSKKAVETALTQTED